MQNPQRSRFNSYLMFKEVETKVQSAEIVALINFSFRFGCSHNANTPTCKLRRGEGEKSK